MRGDDSLEIDFMGRREAERDTFSASRLRIEFIAPFAVFQHLDLRLRKHRPEVGSMIVAPGDEDVRWLYVGRSLNHVCLCHIPQ